MRPAAASTTTLCSAADSPSCRVRPLRAPSWRVPSPPTPRRRNRGTHDARFDRRPCGPLLPSPPAHDPEVEQGAGPIERSLVPTCSPAALLEQRVGRGQVTIAAATSPRQRRISASTHDRPSAVGVLFPAFEQRHRLGRSARARSAPRRSGPPPGEPGIGEPFASLARSAATKWAQAAASIATPQRGDPDRRLA